MMLRLERTFGNRSGKRGFTLIELLVVIAIIGILAAVVLVSLNNARIRGRDARRLSDLQAISLAMELSADQNGGQYPNQVNDAGPTAALFTGIAGALVTDDLIPGTPDDPLAGRDYVGRVSDARTSYVLGGDLELDNQACDADYDGADFEGGANSCDDPAGPDCGAADADNVDYCICQGPAC